MAVLLYFGKLQDIAGAPQQQISLLQPVSIAALITTIDAKDPLLGAALSSPDVQFALNDQLVDRDSLLNDRDELAFLPRVSGGCSK